MAIKELFYDNRPRVLLDPRASQRIDPRFTFTRDSTGTYVDSDGLIKTAAVDEPRFDRDPVTGESLGLLIEEERTNLVTNSETFLFVPLGTNPPSISTVSNQVLPSGEIGSVKFVVYSSGDTRARLRVNGSFTGTYRGSIYWKLKDGGTWARYDRPADNAGSFLYSDFSPVMLGIPNGSEVYFTFGQIELGSFPTSYIPTSGSTVTRAADLLSTEAPLPATGSLYIDARAISANENDTLLSLKNSSNDKIDLAYLSNTATYNSLALIANYDGTSKSSLPLPVPTTDRERNIITYGTNNYQYGRDSSRFAPSLSSAIPTGLNKLSIGHDAVDPTKAFNGYINTVYAWSGELTPEVAEALVRGEIDAINADTYSPTGPAGSLALVINTQGVEADGEKTFTLPAESVANDNDIVITWGDGTESGLDGACCGTRRCRLDARLPSRRYLPCFRRRAAAKYQIQQHQ
jgi:hypothetical protein